MNASENSIGNKRNGKGKKMIKSGFGTFEIDTPHDLLSSFSRITVRIIPDVKDWQNRPLESVYCIVWFDAMHYKIKVDGKIVHRALYNILGINKEGYREV